MAVNSAKRHVLNGKRCARGGSSRPRSRRSVWLQDTYVPLVVFDAPLRMCAALKHLVRIRLGRVERDRLRGVVKSFLLLKCGRALNLFHVCACCECMMDHVSLLWQVHTVEAQESVSKVRVAAENAFAGGDMKKVLTCMFMAAPHGRTARAEHDLSFCGCIYMCGSLRVNDASTRRRSRCCPS
jgi:hypothetical protein